VSANTEGFTFVVIDYFLLVHLLLL
jgi:hypothetical protein